MNGLFGGLALSVLVSSAIAQSYPVRPIRLVVGFAAGGPNDTQARLIGNQLSETLGRQVKGGAPATIDLITGQVHVMMNNVVTSLPAARAGKLRALAVTSAGRSPIAPELPAVAETVPGYEVDAWYGVVAPHATPAAIVAKLNAELVKTIRDPEIHRRLATLGLQPVGGTAQAFDRHLRSELAKWRKVVKEAGIGPTN